MQVTIVYVHVKRNHIDAFIKATQKNYDASIKENGNRRFDVLQLEDDPSRFVLYEAYEHLDDVASHKRTQHYLEWRETVADWMASHREGISYIGLYPQ